MDFQVIIENYQENENSPGSYEKKFKSNTTIKDVLQEFGFDSAYVVNVQQEIIKPQITLNEIKTLYDCGTQEQKLVLELFSEDNSHGTYIKLKYSFNNPDKSNIIKWDIEKQDTTLYSYFLHFNPKQIIHKNKSINPQLSLKNIKQNADDEVELIILDKELDQDEILVIIYSDQFSQKVGTYDLVQNQQQNIGEAALLSNINQGLEIQEQIIYYQIEKRSVTIESILQKLTNYNIFALQSSKGVLDSKKTLGYYFKIDLQCKLLIIQNKLPVQNIQIEQGKVLVNVFQQGQLILRQLFDQFYKLSMVQKHVSQKIKGDIYFIMANKDDLQPSDDLSDFDEQELYLEVIVKQVDYDEMEAYLKQTLKQVQQLKQKQKNIEITQESINPIYKKLIQKDSIINRLQQIIEQQKYKKDQKDIILKMKTISYTQSEQINSGQV
ncbi:unnamed protein product [Paramecium primaurelia]|uniref:Uncharacterized protein n=1 Tax=Paramecium primaurelia TaxID=5886 RepID=A0A8S1NX50_PARPR|nr:unnamed protein product [Paramecium primaurelia]